jgi:hypothetical protein
VLHYVETLCVVWPILHATMSSSADTAPRSLSKPAAMYLQPITAANSVSQNTTEPVHKHLNSLYSLLQYMITKMISSDMKGVRSIQPAIGVLFNTLYDSTPCANNPGLQSLVS